MRQPVPIQCQLYPTRCNGEPFTINCVPDFVTNGSTFLDLERETGLVTGPDKDVPGLVMLYQRAIVMLAIIKIVTGGKSHTTIRGEWKFLPEGEVFFFSMGFHFCDILIYSWKHRQYVKCCAQKGVVSQKFGQEAERAASCSAKERDVQVSLLRSHYMLDVYLRKISMLALFFTPSMTSKLMPKTIPTINAIM